MKKLIAVLSLALVGVLGLTACGPSSEYTQRKEKQSEITLDNSLGIKSQEQRLEREDDVNAIRYVYLFAPMSKDVIGYYTINGGVYGADTQLAPEQEIICRYSGDSCQTVDSAKDNGTYGGGDGGVFFFTTEGVLIETVLPYLQSDAPIAVYAETPKLTE